MSRFRLLFPLLLVVLLAFASVQAGGPLVLCAPNQPLIWPAGGASIPFNPDLGGLGSMSNAVAVAQTEAAFALWQAVPTATATYVDAGPLPIDVDITNFGPIFDPTVPSGLNPIVYDQDGSIFDLLFGAGAGVLGFSGPQFILPVSCEIVQAVTFLNGGLIGPTLVSPSDFLAVQVHEFGHFSGLDHSVVNGQIVLGDSTGPTPDSSTFPPVPLFHKIETMYPFIFLDGGQESPDRDDVASLSRLYPAPGYFSSSGTISGRILAPNGETPLSGVNVIARNLADPFDDALSAISGGFGNPGEYTLTGLTPSAEYALYIDSIFAGGFSTPPLVPFPGPEEFYNGADESNNFSSVDDPLDFTPLNPLAGVPEDGVDVIFNGPGLGEPLNLGDDGSIEIFLPFDLQLCGSKYSAVFVNANGNLTFGASSPLFLESAVNFLAGPPRIAGVWDDLNPSAAGNVFYDTDRKKYLTVFFQDVPEYPSTGANTFSITLEESTISIDYESLSVQDGLAGVSCGGALTTGLEIESDLSSIGTDEKGKAKKIKLDTQATVFENFQSGDNDLSSLSLEFDADKGFEDKLESGRDPEKAKKIYLPFDSTEEFTAIDPSGDDVDFFQLEKLDAGTVIEAEVLYGQLDTVMGFFRLEGEGKNATLSFLAFDDDGGSGLLSRIVFAVPEDGDYILGISTYPDLAFLGTGGSGGRYVLSVTATP